MRLDDSRDFNYISKELYENKYKLFLIHDRFYKKCSNKVLDEEVVQELRNIILNNKHIAKFYGVEKRTISMLAKVSITNGDKSSHSITKGPKVSNVIKRLNIANDEDNLLTEAMKNKEDIYDEGMKKSLTKKLNQVVI